MYNPVFSIDIFINDTAGCRMQTGIGRSLKECFIIDWQQFALREIC